MDLFDGMDLFDVNQPEPTRFPIRLSERWEAVVLLSSRGVLLMGLFLDGELLHVVNRAVGQA